MVVLHYLHLLVLNLRPNVPRLPRVEMESAQWCTARQGRLTAPGKDVASALTKRNLALVGGIFLLPSRDWLSSEESSRDWL
eukprot:5557805-Pyramimonas_sp.AAC.1